MALIDQQLREVWAALAAHGGQRSNALRAVRVKRLRGITDLQVRFPYPVCVLAGANGCGKSTVLFACACAYWNPSGFGRNFSPSNLFPSFSSQRSVLGDTLDNTALEFDFVHGGASQVLAWKRSRGGAWRKTGTRPTRPLYLRTLANLTNPSEVRSLRRLASKPFATGELTEELLIFAHRILPWRYRNLSIISTRTRDLLFAEVEGERETSYSEFHMSAGERAILRLSKDISGLQNALVLIDEVEAGLHPYTQQQAMLELQRIALRQNLQILVASHSPVVLDSVPQEARLFLDRDKRTGEVRALPPYRDIFQKALYGQSRDQLSILCEDAIAENIIRGVLDVLNATMGLRHDDFMVGRNTGRDEFASHIHTLGKFRKLNDFLLVLDGDSRDYETKLRGAADQYGHLLQPLFLPGEDAPEQWVWQALGEQSKQYAKALGLSTDDLERRMREIEQLAEGSLKRRKNAKSTLSMLATELNRLPEDIARIAGRLEADCNRGTMARFRLELQEQINKWRGGAP